MHLNYMMTLQYLEHQRKIANNIDMLYLRIELNYR